MVAISKVIDFAMIKAYRLINLLKNELLTKMRVPSIFTFFVTIFYYYVKINADI